MNKSMLSPKKLTMESFLDKYALLSVFIAMVIVFSILSPSFFTLSNAVNIILSSVSVGIATIGMAIVIMQGGIDLSAGSAMYLAAIVCSKIMNTGMNVAVFIIIALAVGATVGALNGFLITKFKVLPFIATYGTMMLARGIAMYLSGQKNVIFSDPVAKQIATNQLFGVPVIVYAFALVLLLTWFVLGRTPFGRQLYAIGNNQRAAEKIGINVSQRRMVAYIICGACAGVAGLIAGAQSGAFNTSLGDGKEFTFIAAAVLGGVSLSGGKARVFPHLIVGILITTGVEAGLVMTGANPYLYQIVRGGLIALAVVIDSIHSRAELR